MPRLDDDSRSVEFGGYSVPGGYEAVEESQPAGHWERALGHRAVDLKKPRVGPFESVFAKRWPAFNSSAFVNSSRSLFEHRVYAVEE